MRTAAMGMHITSAEAEALAREIAEHAGITPDEAVLLALREKRAALEDVSTYEQRVQQLLDYGRRLRHRRKPGSSDTSDLYDDEFGLPR